MNKKSNKFVIIFLILMMVLPFFTFNVGATDVVIEDFDSYAEGVHSGVNPNLLCTWSGDRGITSTTQFKSSPMSLKIPMTSSDITNEYINLTTNMSMTGFSFWFYYGGANSGGDTKIWLKNSSGTNIIKFYMDWGAGQDWKIQDYDSDYALCTVQSIGWWNFGFQSNRSVGNPINYVYYYLKNATGVIKFEVEKRWISLNEYDDQSLSMVLIRSDDDGVAGASNYFDDFTLPDYTPPEYEGDFDFGSTDNIGNLDTSCFIGTGDRKELEFVYYVPVTINATGFDLLVDSDMHYWDDDLLNYDLYINGESMDHPTEWVQYSNAYVLRWEFTTPKVIDNEAILYELWHDVGTPVHYWNVGTGCNHRDMDGDGFVRMRYSNTYPNGAYDGSVLLYDVAYQIYFDTFSFVEDVIDVTYDSITTIDGSYYVGDSVPLTYMLQASNMIYDNYVKIWNDDTSTEITIDSMQGFPYLCLNQIETVGFVPFVSANYTAQLYINGANVTNVSFFVGENVNPDMHVFTYPNPSKVGQEIRVQYNYDHPSDRDGAIFFCIFPNLNSYISVNHLSDGDSGFWSETHNTAGTYYYILAVDITGNGTYGIVDNGIHPHKVVSEQVINYFTLNDKLRLSEDGIASQRVNGECNMISGNCFIYDNNKLIRTITESSFSYSYDVYTAGLHTVEMRLITNVTTVLFTQNYTVSTFTGEVGAEDTSYIVRDWIYDLYGDIGVFIAGVCVVLGFMFIPFALVLYVNVSYNKNIALGDLHWSIYLIFAIVGVIVDVQLHLAELWIILLICVVSIAIAVITYKGNR